MIVGGLLVVVGLIGYWTHGKAVRGRTCATKNEALKAVGLKE